MDVEGALGLRQGLELHPVPTREQLPPTLQRQRPALEWCSLRCTCRKDGEVLGDILSRWEPIGCRRGITLFTFETSGHLHKQLLTPASKAHVNRSTGMALKWSRHRAGFPFHRSRG